MRLQTPKVLSDKPVLKGEDAKFGFQGYAGTLARLIASSGTETPLVIGVYGEWGSGKTTLMQMVRTKLEEGTVELGHEGSSSVCTAEGAEAFAPCRVVWFDAWRYAKEEEMWVALVRTIVKAMLRDAGFVDQVEVRLRDLRRKYNWPKALASVVAGVVTAGRVGVRVEESRLAQNVAFYDEFRIFFDEVVECYLKRDQGSVLAVFVDDLDRCLPSKIVQVLESVRLFVDRPGCVFVLGADQRVIVSAIRAHYEAHGLLEVGAEEYLDKIVQVRFELPPLRTSDVEDYVRNLPGLEASTREYLEIIVRGVRTNPRRIKRFVNHLDLQWSLLTNMGLGDRIRRKGLAEWLVLNEACPAFGERVRELRGEPQEVERMIGALKEVARLPIEERKKEVEADKELQSLITGETVFEVMQTGEFEFGRSELEIYVHLSALPSLRSREEELAYEVDRVLNELTDHEKRLIELWLGIGGTRPMSLEDIARQFDLNEEEVEDRIGKALRKLRHPTRSRKLKGFMDLAERSDARPEALLVRAVILGEPLPAGREEQGK